MTKWCCRTVRRAREPRRITSRNLKKAENFANRVPGAAALKGDDGTDEPAGATILGQWGEIPGNFAKCLPG
nr:hypothetical protein [Methylobacterium pseudosasicola]